MSVMHKIEMRALEYAIKQKGASRIIYTPNHCGKRKATMLTIELVVKYDGRACLPSSSDLISLRLRVLE